MLNPREIYRLGVYGGFAPLPHHRQLSFDEKDESYPGVIARDSGGFHLRMQLNDALIESYVGLNS